jgi:peptide/nickel transport system permease protein
MTAVLDEPEVESGPRVRRAEWAHVLLAAAKTGRGAFGLALVLIVAAVAFIGPFFKPYDPNAFVTTPFAAPSSTYKLGGDVLGRDVLSRVLGGGWQLLIMAALATALGVVLGAAAGISAAYLRGARDGIIMRTVDVILAFPQLVFALLLVSVIGPKDWLLVLAVGLSHAPQVARVLRSSALDVSERDFVKAVEITGVRSSKVMNREILPNLVTPLMVEIGLRMTYSIVIMAGLSFLGFGLQPPNPNWGTMINENRIGITLNPWATLAPAILIAILTIGLNTFTDSISRAALGVDRAEKALANEGIVATDAVS